MGTEENDGQEGRIWCQLKKGYEGGGGKSGTAQRFNRSDKMRAVLFVKSRRGRKDDR